MGEFHSKSTVYGALAFKVLDDFSLDFGKGADEELEPIKYKLKREEIDKRIRKLSEKKGIKTPAKSVSDSTKGRVLEDLSSLGLVGREDRKYFSKRKRELFKEVSKNVVEDYRRKTETKVVEETFRLIYEEPKLGFKEGTEFRRNEQSARRKISRYIWRILRTILKEIGSGPPHQTKQNIEGFFDKGTKKRERKIISRIDEI